MASIHRSTGSKYFYAYFRDHEGRQIKKSTRLTAERKAQRLADGWEEESRALKGLRKQDQKEAANLVLEAQRLGDTGLLTSDKLRELLERVGEIYGVSVAAYTIEKWLRTWQKDREEQVSASTKKSHTRTIDAFLDYLGEERIAKPLSSITDDEIRGFRATLKGKGSTKNGYLKILRAAFGDAHTHGLLTRNITKAVPLFSTDDAAEVMDFSPEEVSRLVAACDDEYRTLILISFYTGMRMMDCATLTWKSFDQENATIRVRTEKTKTWVWMPCHPVLFAEFERILLAQDGDEEFVLPELALKTNAAMSGQFTRVIMKRAKVPRQAFDGNVEGKRSFHSLKHSTVTQLAELGIDEATRMKLVGHSDKRSHRTYTHRELEGLREQLAQVPNVTGFDDADTASDT